MQKKSHIRCKCGFQCIALLCVDLLCFGAQGLCKVSETPS